MASTLMPQFINAPTRPFPSEKPYFGGRSGQPGRSSLGGSRKCALLYCLQQYLRAPSGGTCPLHPNAAGRCEPFRFVQGLRPLRRKAAIPGVRRGPDVSRIWETSERRRCNGFAPRQARKTRTAAQHSDNENIHGGNKPRHLERRTPPYLRKPQNTLQPPRSSWPRSGTGCSGWKTDRSTSATKHESSGPTG